MKEVLNFKIGLSGSSAIKQPEFSICIESTELVSGALTKKPNEIEYFTFDVEVNEGQSSIIIYFNNKLDVDTVRDHKGNIVQDLTLNIESIEVDGINLGQMIWTHSHYFPKYPLNYAAEQRKLGKQLEDSIQNCVNLGWNGKWTFPFQSPFYIWLLENI